MPTTYPLSTLAAAVTPAGISAPSYEDVLASLKASFKNIYGQDAYLEADSQDGQLLAIFAKAIHDCNMSTIAAYNNFSPQTAVGAGLSNAVKINHLRRASATRSQVNVTLTGQAGTTISNGIAGDDNGQRWMLPSVVVIPPGGTILVTAQAENEGAVAAPAGSVTKILTPTAGWQSITNGSAATPGLPVEADAQLRLRQEQAPAMSSIAVLQGLKAAILSLPGVEYCAVYENDTSATDANGIPEHSISCVVKGGVAADIANAIYTKKTPGTGTHGTTTVSVIDITGAARDIKFFAVTEVSLKVGLSLQPGASYTTAIADQIKASISAFINALGVGEDLVVNRLYAPALLGGIPASETYKITVLQAALHPAGTLGTTDVVIAFNERAVCAPDKVTITLV